MYRNKKSCAEIRNKDRQNQNSRMKSKIMCRNQDVISENLKSHTVDFISAGKFRIALHTFPSSHSVQSASPLACAQYMVEENEWQIGQIPQGWEQFLVFQNCVCTLGIGGTRVNFPVGGHLALEVRFSCCYIISHVRCV